MSFNFLLLGAPLGLFVHQDYKYLAANPDGIGNDFVVEVTC